MISSYQLTATAVSGDAGNDTIILILVMTWDTLMLANLVRLS